MLVRDASRGDRKAIDALVERNLPMLRAFIRLKAGRTILRKESSSDLVQSVCVELLSNLPVTGFNDEAGFRKWLCTAALNKIKERARYYRAEKRDVAREVSASGQAPPDETQLLGCYATIWTPSQDAMLHEQIERLEASFARLPERYRDIIVSAKIVGLSHAELANELGRSEEAVRQLLSRALARLFMLLNDPEARS